MGDTVMQISPSVLWSETLSPDRGQLKELSEADEEEENGSPAFEVLEPNHSFLYSTISARNLQVSKISFLNLSLPATAEEEEEEEADFVLRLDGDETKEANGFEGIVTNEEKPTPKRTTPCKRISYKIKRSSSAYRKLNGRNPIRGSTVAELASKFDKLCTEKRFILDDPKFAQIIKRVNSQNYSQGDAGKINRKSSIKMMNVDDRGIRKIPSKQSNENSAGSVEKSVSVRAAIKIFEDRQQNGTKNLQLKPKLPEKKFSKSLETIPSITVSHSDHNDGIVRVINKDDDDFEVPVLIVNIPIEKRIRSESAYEITHVKSRTKETLAKFKLDLESKLSNFDGSQLNSPKLSPAQEKVEEAYDLVTPTSEKSVPGKKVQPPVPPKPKNVDRKKKKPEESEDAKSISPLQVQEDPPKVTEQEKTYEELSLPSSVATHSYEDIEQKSDDGYEAIIPLNIVEQNIYETLPSMSDSPPPLPKRQEELLPPKLPSKVSYYKVRAGDETNSYEIIETGDAFRMAPNSDGSSESSYDTLLQLKWNGSNGSNRGSLISCDQQSNSLYGRSIPSWTEECLNYKADTDSFSDSSGDWNDLDDNEELSYPEAVVQKRKGSANLPEKPPDTNSEADIDHHYESVPERFLQTDYAADSFDSDYDVSENRTNATYNNVDLTNAQLPDAPNSQSNVLDRLSTAGKNLKRLFSKNDLTKSLGRIAKRKSRGDIESLRSNALDRTKARSSGKLDQSSEANATPRSSINSQESEQNSELYDKHKFKSKAKSTFYLTETIDISNADKIDCDRRRNSLFPIDPKSKNGKSSPVRPSVPPPPLPKQPSPNASSNSSDNRRSTSWYIESGLFKNSDGAPIGNPNNRKSSASWYAEVGLYQSDPTSTPSTSSAENSGSGVSNRNEMEEGNYENTEEYHNLRNENDYHNSIDSFGSNETKMDKSSTLLSEDMIHILQEEPLYQFYNQAIVESICHEGTDWDSDGYEEITKSEGCEKRSRPSAMDLITNGNVSVTRTLWCEIPEVKHSEIFKTLTIEQKKLQEAKFEMMTSEASYLNSLNVLTKHFITNLEMCKSVTKEDLDMLFTRIPEVKNCSEKLLQDLEKCWQDNILLQNICNIIDKHAEENFSVYVSYVENQVLLESTLKKLKESADFKETLQRLETSMDCQALTLYSFLMLPMQRVTRWPLLLDAVLKRLSPGDAEYLPCQCALTTINKIANQCNEAARRKEREAEMKTLVHRLDFGSHQSSFNLMSEGRWLIKSGPVTHMLARGDDGKLTFGKKLIKKPLFLFLFNDLFMVAKASEDNYTVLHYCPRNMIEINQDLGPNLPFKDAANRHLIFLTILENQHEKLVEILFSCGSTTDKERWLNALAPVKSEDPDETLYERWDCPQVTVIYDYYSHQPDELSISKGDIIYVVRKMSDGWYYGERLRDGECGWFPANYVTEIVNPHVRARNLRQRYRLLAFTQNYFNSK